MGKLMTDATGQQIVNAINNIPAGSGGGSGGSLGLPPSDGKTYVMRDGHWVEASILTGSAGTDTTATTETVNEDGQASVTFYFPWKYAVTATNTLIKDRLKTEWKYPYEAGVIKSITCMCGTTGASITLMVDGVNVYGPVTPAKTSAERAVNYEIQKGQKVEIAIMTPSTEASDLTVTVNMDVGHRTIEYIGQADLKPNVYVCGGSASAWSNNGPKTPDNKFQLITMPEVCKLREGYNSFTAKSADGKLYLCGDMGGNKHTFLGLSAAPTTPVEIPNEDGSIVDVIAASGKLYTLRKDKSISWGTASTEHLFATDFDALPELSNYNEDLYSLYNFFLTSGCVEFSGAHFYNSVSYFNCYSLPEGKRCKKVLGGSTSAPWLALGEDGILYSWGSSKFTAVDFPYGRIKNLWGVKGENLYLVQNEDNELYVRGDTTKSTSYCGYMGTSINAENEFIKVGVFDVKKIMISNYCTFMLTNDGRLYHAGKDTKITNTTHANGFVQVFPNYKFYDFAAIGAGGSNGTLVAIAEYLGEIAE